MRRHAAINIFVDGNSAHSAQIQLGGLGSVYHDRDIAVTFSDNAVIGKNRAIRCKKSNSAIR